MAVHLRKSVAAQILGGLLALILMFSWVPSAVADDYIPGLLRVMVNIRFKSDKCKNLNKCIDALLKSYGKRIKVLPNKKGRKSWPPYRNILVKAGHEKTWISTLKKSPVVKRVKRLRESDDRLPTMADNKTLGTPFFLLKGNGDKALFESLPDFLRETYQGKCDDCIQSEESFPRSKRVLVAYLNREVIKEEDFVETLEFTFLMIDGEELEFTTIVSGQYAPNSQQGVPPTEFQNMESQYDEQLRAYTAEIKGKLENYLSK
ncbi:MAG: hypothetical protein DRR08_16535 [Candidatus Parabeggiatoa sp. nov. 2]|nr:MAG: hypothetical protein B6247_23280 [Beggiatoa sp. 4572_84]RKZ58383.1 MAG: hypothetical protein DRR08_16535 [Gammaproteobacteria bacterium]HEC83975.1 hypothetical protein [Thioploca sp.]